MPSTINPPIATIVCTVGSMVNILQGYIFNFNILFCRKTYIMEYDDAQLFFYFDPPLAIGKKTFDTLSLASQRLSAIIEEIKSYTDNEPSEIDIRKYPNGKTSLIVNLSCVNADIFCKLSHDFYEKFPEYDGWEHKISHVSTIYSWRERLRRQWNRVVYGRQN